MKAFFYTVWFISSLFLSFNTMASSNSQSFDKIKLLSQKDYQLILFVSSHCYFCHKFAPIVKEISNNYNLPITVFSFDGEPVSPFQLVFPTNKKIVTHYYKGREEVMPVLILTKKTSKNSTSKNFVVIAEGYYNKEHIENKLLYYAKQGGVISL